MAAANSSNRHPDTKKVIPIRMIGNILYSGSQALASQFAVSASTNGEIRRLTRA
jgi:hypothetical protein